MMKMQTRYGRKTTPPPMRFQKRDAQIIQAIYTYDGMLARRQIKKLFWPHASDQAMERRLMLLFHAGYLNLPGPVQRRTQAIPEPIVFLGWRGILFNASQLGVEIEAPNLIIENQLRGLEKEIRQAGLFWMREPRWSQLGHDIAVNDFRFSVEIAAEKWPSLTLEKWVPEGEFFRNMDTIAISGFGKKRKKGVRPDGFFELTDGLRIINNSPAKGRFLLELDNSTHPLGRFGYQKAIPGLAYIRSEAYRKRFGFNSGRWLVVCKSEERMRNLKKQTEKVLGNKASIFLFTLMDHARPESIFSEAIWWQGASDEKIALVGNIGARN